MIMIESNNTDKDETKQKGINKRKLSSIIHVEKRINNKSGEKKKKNLVPCLKSKRLFI